MHFKRADLKAIRRVLKRIDSGAIESITALLSEIAAMVGADHAEFSTWRFSPDGQRSLGERTVFDPRDLQVPLYVLPTDERPNGVHEPTPNDPVRTWTSDTAPGWGGPALLSVRRNAPHQLLLLALRRASEHTMFTARQAAVIDALNRCHELWDATDRLMPRPQP